MTKRLNPDGTAGRESLRPGQDPTRAIERLYGHGRSYGDDDKPEAIRTGSRGRAYTGMDNLEDPAGLRENSQRNQTPDNRHCANYDNDTPNNWLRGVGERATNKPGFDRTNTKRGR